MDRKKPGWTTQMDPKHVTEHLATLPRAQLIDILRGVFDALETPDKRPCGTAERERFFLGRAQRLNVSKSFEPDRWEWCIDAVAYPDLTEHPNHRDYGDVLCQDGQCDSCGIDVCATVKRGVCPVCGSEVGLT